MQYNINPAISVSALTNRIRSVLESDFVGIDVQGEISNFKHHSSGHRYFTLKDDKAQIKCVMWRGKFLSFQPRDGMQVIAKGSLTVYPPQGNYQLDCSDLRPFGEGDLYLAYEALKAKLMAEGYFDANRKKALPKLPFSIGISTSPTGAAVQDMLSTLKRRLPFTTVYFRPTLVQGEGSAEDIVRAIKDLEKTPAEIIIIGRGGGSIEDLWSYNTEMVAKAIFDCSKPIISAVGHETDFTIADFVADYRAPTPSAAAEHATPDRAELLDQLTHYYQRLFQKINSQLKSYQMHLLHLQKRLKHPSEKITQQAQQLDQLEKNLYRIMKFYLQHKHEKIAHYAQTLDSLSPLKVLQRGFSITKNKVTNKIILHRDDVSVGEHIITRLIDGEIESQVI